MASSNNQNRERSLEIGDLELEVDKLNAALQQFLVSARDALKNYLSPEIFHTSLHELALTIKLLQLGYNKLFLSRALEQLPMNPIQEIQAIDENDELTPLGKILV
ncbi:unnamed protein product [Rotaria sp. Silwood2]|nr:unnamed protein product [Rotaria sp. Silwood2]